MKKILCIALIAFSMTAQAQSVGSIIENNEAISAASENPGLTLKEKITVVNNEVEAGTITKEQAFLIISELSDKAPDEAVDVVSSESYNEEWGGSHNPFEEAMEVKMDTVVKYRTEISPFIAFGVGNVATDKMFANSEFGYMRSNYVEWGLALRTPFSKTDNRWGVRYGLSFKYNGLATTGNKEFTLNGNQTFTSVSDKNLRKGYAYLRNTYISIPFSLDFTTANKTYNAANRKFVKNAGYNFGIGGYIGYNINSKQHLRYNDENGYKIYEQQKGDWNVNDFQYGLMAYIGQDKFKIVAKYDLSPVFSDNTVDQNYWSLGLQIGF